jgi:hypothetical protein
MTAEQYSKENPLKGRGRNFYSQFIHKKSNISPNDEAIPLTSYAELHRQFSDTASKLKINTKLTKAPEQTLIEASDIVKIFNLKDKLGSEGSNLVKNIAQSEIAPRHVPDNLNKIAQMIYQEITPRVEPVTTYIKKRPLGFIPFGGTEIIHTKYIFDDDSPQKIEGDPVTIERRTFWDRLFGRL